MVKALNEAGSLTTVCQARIKLKSYAPLSISEDCAPVFLAPLLAEVKAMDGQEVSLTCICQSQPTAQVKWLRSAPEDTDKLIPLMFTNDIKSSFDAETGKVTLKICDAYPQDTGVYVCVAANALGTAQTKTSLTVESRQPAVKLTTLFLSILFFLSSV